VAGASPGEYAGRVNSARAREVAAVLVKAALVALLLFELGALVKNFIETSTRFAGVDSRYFYDVATQIVNGQLPYRDFAFEYPPLAIPPLLLPRLILNVIGGGAFRYGWLLVLENMVIVIATAACLVPLVRRGWSASSSGRTVAGYGLLVLATPVLFWRFDSFPTLLMTLGLVAFAYGSRLPSGLAIGAGVAAKIFPLAVVPVLALADVLQRQWRKAALLIAGAAGAVALVGVLTWIGAGGRAELYFVSYHADRGVQLESLLASIALAGQLLGGPTGRVFNDFGAFQIDSPLLADFPWLELMIAAVLVGALAVSTFVRFRRDVAVYGEVQPQTLVTQLLAALLVVLLAYRVLSPQFIVWILPLAALRPRTEFWAFFVLCLMTLAVYPLTYPGLVALDERAMLLLIARNALMVGLLVWLLGWGTTAPSPGSNVEGVGALEPL
jgi:hypothetical protein